MFRHSFDGVNHTWVEIVGDEDAAYRPAVRVFDSPHVAQQLDDSIRRGRTGLQFYDNEVASIIFGGDVNAP